MIDLATLRQDPDAVKRSQAARGESESLVDDVVAADAHRRTVVGEFEAVRADQKAKGALVAKAQEQACPGGYASVETLHKLCPGT